LTYLERQTSYGPDKLRREEAEVEEKIRLKHYVSPSNEARHIVLVLIFSSASSSSASSQ
jgi:hypothetical protein